MLLVVFSCMAAEKYAEAYESLFRIDRKYFEALRRWMSDRTQTLSRMVRGFSTTWDSLTLLTRIQNPRMSKAVARAVAYDKYQMIVSFQDLGEVCVCVEQFCGCCRQYVCVEFMMFCRAARGADHQGAAMDERSIESASCGSTEHA